MKSSTISSIYVLFHEHDAMPCGAQQILEKLLEINIRFFVRKNPNKKCDWHDEGQASTFCVYYWYAIVWLHTRGLLLCCNLDDIWSIL
jgi:hypothetical protein